MKWLSGLVKKSVVDVKLIELYLEYKVLCKNTNPARRGADWVSVRREVVTSQINAFEEILNTGRGLERE